LIDADKAKVATARAAHAAAVIACQETAYDAYARTLATADADHATKIKAIEKLIDDKLPPGAG